MYKDREKAKEYSKEWIRKDFAANPEKRRKWRRESYARLAAERAVNPAPIPDTKRCPCCKTVKPEAEFNRQRSACDGLRAMCRTCEYAKKQERYWRDPEAARARVSARTLRWKTANPERARALNIKSMLKHKYGMTVGDYDQMFQAQKGLCLLCDQAGTRVNGPGALEVDHDHVTGRVRGLLCRSCNWGLGMLGDTPERLSRAVAYVSN